MGHLHLIIKGDRKAALAAAKKREVTLFSTHPSRSDHDETHAMCGDEYLPAVRGWFNEEGPREAPFPIGTLLLWSEQTSVHAYAPIKEGQSRETNEAH